jgi:hypothetical protein
MHEWVLNHAFHLGLLLRCVAAALLPGLALRLPLRFFQFADEVVDF